MNKRWHTPVMIMMMTSRRHPQGKRASAAWFRFRVERQQEMQIEQSKEAMVEAIRKNDRDGVIKLLKNKFDVNQTLEVRRESPEDGPPILHPHLSWEKNYTALTYASELGHATIVNDLIHHRADVNIKTCDRFTALMNASWMGREDVVRSLITNGADVNASASSSCFRNTALLMAIENHKFAVAILLLQSSTIKVNYQNTLRYTALIAACCCQCDEQDGLLKVVEKLLSFDEIDVNLKSSERYRGTHRGVTALMVASENGHTEIVGALLRTPKIDVDARRLLDDHQLKSHMEKWTALVHATSSERGNADVVRALIEAGADVNATDDYHRTPLMNASKCGQTEMVRELLSNIQVKENVSATDDLQYTALSLAVDREAVDREKNKSSNVDVVHALLCAGIDTDIKNHKGETALDIATRLFNNASPDDPMLWAKGIMKDYLTEWLKQKPEERKEAIRTGIWSPSWNPEKHKHSSQNVRKNTTAAITALTIKDQLPKGQGMGVIGEQVAAAMRAIDLGVPFKPY